jgi:acyl-CoA reductase-like NAD-dependent aldehyde dehydrogenase
MQARHWINGEWIDSDSAQQAESLNPATGLPLGSFADGGAPEAERAIAAARAALHGTAWAHTPKLREKVLLAFADRMEAALPELADLLTAENGKLRGESMGELNASISELRYYAGLSRNIFGRTMEVEPGLYSDLSREPPGVAGIIVPWNAPVVLMVRSLAPALAAGCTCVVKNAPQTALVSARVFELLAEVADLPAGVVNCFAETGSKGAIALVDSVDVDVISYTGSTGVGKQIMAAGAATLKRMNLELGGSAPCIVLEDADLERAAPALVKAGMFMAGQYCCSATRVLVHERILDAAQAAFTRSMQALKVGPGNDPASEMGPVVDAAGRDRVLALLEDSSKVDEMLCRGEALGGELADGFFIGPSLVHVQNENSPLYTGEVFGPVLALDSFADEAEAITKANDTRFGLAASVWSADLRASKRVANRLQSGTVWINSHGRTFAEIETGGYKESGIGRLHGVEGLAEFLQTKHVSWSTDF